MNPNCTLGVTKIAFNPNTWTTDFNLLYIDAPGTGFSYPVGKPDPTTNPSIGTDMDRDAGIFVEVLLRFLSRHPQIRSKRVVIVGESYGGVRAQLMLHHLLRYDTLNRSDSSYQDFQVFFQVQSYYAARFGTTTPRAQDILQQFGHQVLIQPAIGGLTQISHPTTGSLDEFDPVAKPDHAPTQNCLSAGCQFGAPAMGSIPATDPTCDVRDCDRRPLWADDLETVAMTNLTTLGVLTAALGANPTNIEWMYARSRDLAYARATGDIIPTPELMRVFGTLTSPTDNYFLSTNALAQNTYPGARSWDFPASAGVDRARDFLNNSASGVATLITVARHDVTIWSPDIPYAISTMQKAGSFPGLLTCVDLPDGCVGYGHDLLNEALYPPGAPTRLGAMALFFDPPNRPVVWVSMPGYYDSGHSISQRTPAELLSDVKDWYGRTPH